MEPRSSEQLPTPIEQAPASLESSSGESLSFQQPERREKDSTNERVGEQHRPTTHAPVVQLPTPVQVAVPEPQVQAQDNSGHPAVAADDDLIEKEWVDKAKQIVADTKNDPHRREKAVSVLQSDYLRKRYGKELGKEAA